MLVALQCCLFSTIAGVRLSRGADRLRRVKFLVTYGAPKAAAEPLQDATSEDGCFEGWRVVAETECGCRNPFAWGNCEVKKVCKDPVTQLPHGGYEHPSLKLMTLFVNHWPKSVRGGCGESSNSGKGDISLHNFDKYELLTKDDEDIGSSSIFAKLVQETNRRSPVESAYFGGSWQMRGWNFLGSDMKSDEIVHLVQNDASHECILSFGQEEADKYPELPSGSSTSFCNLPAKVHSGFRDQLLASLSSDDYLANIKPKLSHCATIAVTGHSKGGAIATLFAACANNGAIAGGNKDFELLNWWTRR